MHAPIGHPGLSPRSPISYAYTNFCNLVCTMDIANGMYRFCTSHSYSKKEFKLKGQYREIWSNIKGGAIEDFRESVNNALRMKMMIKTVDGMTFILPTHTVEVYSDSLSFGIDTEFDGVPMRLLDQGEMKQLSNRLDQVYSQAPDGAYVGTEYKQNQPFFLTSFLVNHQGVVHRQIDEGGKLVNTPFNADYVSLWVEQQ